MGNVQSFVRPVALAVLIPIVGSLPIVAIILLKPPCCNDSARLLVHVSTPPHA